MALLFGSRKRDLEERMVLHEGEKLVSVRKYNLTIGAVLLYGLILNFFTVYFGTEYLVELFTVTYPMWYLLVGYLVLVLIGWGLVCCRSAFVSFIGYSLIAIPVGVVLAVYLNGYDNDIILQAVFITAAATFIMWLMALLFPNFFLKMGRVIFLAVIACIGIELIAVFVFQHAPAVFDWVAALLFSTYIGYDWARANKCQKTLNNAVDISTALYLDMINLFMRIVQIMGKSKSKS